MRVANHHRRDTRIGASARRRAALIWISVTPLVGAQTVLLFSLRLAARHQGRGMMDDKGLRRTLIDALDHEPRINAARIGVAVEKGIATLTGRVGCLAEKVATEQAVRRVRGVRGVVLALGTCEDRRQSGRTGMDDEIARRARVV